MSLTEAERIAVGCVMTSFVGAHAPGWLLELAQDGLGGVVELGWPSARPYRVDATVVAHGAARVTTSSVATLLTDEAQGGE
jgi:hypothetical protein